MKKLMLTAVCACAMMFIAAGCCSDAKCDKAVACDAKVACEANVDCAAKGDCPKCEKETCECPQKTVCPIEK